MTERVCGSCRVSRPLEMFYLEQEAKRAAKKGWNKRRMPCRACKSEEMKKAIAVKKAWLIEYKMSRGCMDCGYAEHPAALEFDHRPGEDKKYNLAQALCRSWKSILAEIAKCDVVCANCHRVRTSARVRS